MGRPPYLPLGMILYFLMGLLALLVGVRLFRRPRVHRVAPLRVASVVIAKKAAAASSPRSVRETERLPADHALSEISE